MADWRFLVPAVILPFYIISFPETRTLLNYGLVRLGWLDLVHSPVSFAIGRGVGWVRLLRVGECVDRVRNAIWPMARAIRGVLDFAMAWAPWAGPDMEKLKPVEPWNGFVLGEWWK